MSEIITKIDSTVQKYNMLCEDDTVVVGVSGGADSMLLLHYLLLVRDGYSLNLIVAHVEHGIRGCSSVDDMNFVKSVCKSYNLRFESLSINAVDGAKAAGQSVEEYSRNRRYEFFNSFNADKIAVAHNMSDSVETVLFRLARGTSVKGCRGIEPVRDNIIRPLIDCTSEEVRSECERQSILYRIDETNCDNTYSRNYVRNVIVPAFKELNPSFESAVCRFSQSAAEDDKALDNLASKCIELCKRKNTLNINTLRQYDVSIIKRVIAKMAQPFGVTLDEKHLNGALELLEVNKKFQLKGNLFLASSGGTLRIYNECESEKGAKLGVEVMDIDFYTTADIPMGRGMFCDFDKIIGNPYLKQREPGDTISPEGRNCTKTLKKLFNEEKIPAERRSDMHIIADDCGIIAVFGCAVDERVTIDSNTKRVARFSISTED